MMSVNTKRCFSSFSVVFLFVVAALSHFLIRSQKDSFAKISVVGVVVFSGARCDVSSSYM